jgi:ribosome-binding ATPase
MLSIGIVGLPNVGKSTLFKALTNKQIEIQNYPFTTIDPNVGVVAVPDQRVDALAVFSGSKKKVYTTINFIDIAGLVKGASKGEGLGNKFLANIREVNVIAQVVRVFENEDVLRYDNKIDPIRTDGRPGRPTSNGASPANDIEIINTELIMADLDTIANRITKTTKDAKTIKKASADLIALAKFKSHLESGEIISKLELSDEDQELAKELNLLTSKDFIYVFNVSEDQLINNWQPSDGIKKVIGDASFVTVSNKLELALSEMPKDEKEELLKEFNLPESGLDSLIKISYKTLGLLTFLTTGEDESRAWTANIGDPIPVAVRAIHTDFEKLFIRAEVINWKDLLESGSYANARSKGLIRTEGRDYIIQEGNVVEVLTGR